ncbi:MAG TPA: ribose-phosphate pyrophosphokinase [Sphingomicrobium sp.]|nr:ribose-phosphate pyrophosphokinase [Sphingomicrobium sp.]
MKSPKGHRLADPAEVRAHLLAAAHAGTAISYSDLLGHLGFAFSRPKMRALCAVLGTVDAEAEALGEPELAVLVVRQSDGLPGQGWWVAGGAEKHGHVGDWEGPAARRLVERLQAEAFHYWSERDR